MSQEDDDQPLSMERIPRTIIWDGQELTLPQLRALLESYGEVHAMEISAAEFGIGDQVILGLDDHERYKHSGLRV